MAAISASKGAGLETEEALGCGRKILLGRGVGGFEELQKEQRSRSGTQSESLPWPGWLSPRGCSFFSNKFGFLYLSETFLYLNESVFDGLRHGFR